jgi:peptidoglycan/LPS O-acetylase OafA/YrhL
VATPSSPRRRSRLGALDVLRFLAAAAVVAFHFTARDSPAWDGPVPQEFASIGPWTSYGRLGVALFFVISGFVILMSSWGRDIPHFVASRVGRLYPAYWVSVVVSAGVVFLWPENPAFFGLDITTSDAVLNLTMVQTAFGAPDLDGVYWTLWYEARFYLLIALLMLAGGLTRTRVLAFATLWPIAGAVAGTTASPLLTTLLMPDYAAFFAGGMLLYLLYREGHDWGVWMLVALQCAIALHFSMKMFGPSLTTTTAFAPSPVKLALVTFLCFALVALVTLTPVARWDARWMTFAGALTYPLYLIHENLGWFVISRSREALGAWGAVLAASTVALVASVLLYRLVEKPFGARLRRVTLAMLRPPARAPEAPAAPVPTPLPPRHETTTRTPRVGYGPSRPPVGPATASVSVSHRPEVPTAGTSPRGPR